MEAEAVRGIAQSVAEYGILGLGWLLYLLRLGRWDTLLERVLAALGDSTAAAQKNAEILQRILEEVRR